MREKHENGERREKQGLERKEGGTLGRGERWKGRVVCRS